MRYRASEIALNPKYGCQRGLTNIEYAFFHRKRESGPNTSEVLAQELHKAVIKKFKRRKVYARFKDNIWAADLAEMGSLSSKNRRVKVVLPNRFGLKL